MAVPTCGLGAASRLGEGDRWAARHCRQLDTLSSELEAEVALVPWVPEHRCPGGWAQRLPGSSAGRSPVKWKAPLGSPRRSHQPSDFCPGGLPFPLRVPVSLSSPPTGSQPESQSLGEEAGAPLWFHTPLRVWPLQSSCDSCHAQHRLPRGTLLRQSWGTQPLPQPRTGRGAGRWRNRTMARDVYELGDPRAHAPSLAQSARVRFSGTLLALEGMAGSVPAGP